MSNPLESDPAQQHYPAPPYPEKQPPFPEQGGIPGQQSYLGQQYPTSQDPQAAGVPYHHQNQPPSYNYGQNQQVPYAQQQTHSNVVVVSQQPQPVVVTPTYRSDYGSGAMVFAIFASIFAFLCCWWALFCSIPAIIFASNANSAHDAQSAKSNRNVSLILSTVTLFTGIAGIAIILGIIFGYYLPLINDINNRASNFRPFG